MPRAKMQRASRKIQRHARKHINLGRKKCSGPSVAENPVTYTGYISPASGFDGAKYYVLPAGKTIYVGIYGYGVTDYLEAADGIYSYYYGSEEADDFYLKLVNGGTESTVTITLVPTGIEAVADKDALKADAVFDLSGRLLQRGGMQGLPAGIYVVKSGKQTRKVVIK